MPDRGEEEVALAATTPAESHTSGGSHDTAHAQTVPARGTLGDSSDAEAAAPRRTDAAQVFGRYLVLERLGEGGMGVVHRAYDPDLRREVALKLLHVTGPASAQARLLREAQALARVTHPHVVTVYDVGAAGEDVFIAMELVRGATLDQWLARERRTPAQILDVARAAGEGLAAAHAAGIVHRDFKPSNVMVGDDGRVRVLDFGLARPLAEVEATAVAAAPGVDHLGRTLTRHGGVVGTPRYMAPEQRAGQAADERTDQYALCLALCEALAGRMPERDGAVVVVPPLPVSRRVRAAIERGLASDPAKRFASMQELLAEIRPPRRRSLGILAGAAALAAGAIAIVAARPGAAADPCADVGAPFDQMWSPNESVRIHAGFVAHGGAIAESTWQRISPRIEGWGREWKASRREACEATQVRREASAEMMAARMTCLDDRRRELASMLAAFQEADPEVVAAAPKLLGQLEPIARCSDTAALAAIPPKPPDKAAQIDDVTRELDAIKIAVRTNHPAGTIDRAKKALATANALGYAPLVARADYELAQAETTGGKYDDALKDFEAAAIAADRAADDAMRARAWEEVIYVAGWSLRKLDVATHAMDLASGALARVKEPGELTLLLHRYTAQAYQGAGKPAEALAELDKAIALLGPNPDKVQRSDLLNSRGLMLSDLRRFKEAVTSYDEARTLCEEAYGPDNPRVAGILSNTANAMMFYSSDYDQMIALHRRALDITIRAFGPDHPDAATFTNNIVAVLLRLERWADALPLARRAYELRKKALSPDHPYTVRALANIGTALNGLHRPAEAEPLYVQGLAMQARSLPPDHPDIAYLRHLHALNLLDLHRAPEARAELDASLAAYVKKFGRKSDAFPWIESDLVRAEVDAGAASQGLAHAEDALAVAREIDDEYDEALAHWAHARALAGLGRRAEAKAEVATTLDSLAKIGGIDEKLLAGHVADWAKEQGLR